MSRENSSLPSSSTPSASTISVLRVLNGMGDTSVEWDRAQWTAGDPNALGAVAEAERIFRQARATGAVAFRVERDKPAMRLDSFDPTAPEVLVVPPLVGG